MADNKTDRYGQRNTENQSSSSVDYSKLVFDWKNPNMGSSPATGRYEVSDSRSDRIADNRPDRAHAGIPEKRTAAARRIDVPTEAKEKKWFPGGMMEKVRSEIGKIKIDMGKSGQKTKSTGGTKRKTSYTRGTARKGKKKSGKNLIRAWMTRGIALVAFILIFVLLIWGFSRLLSLFGGHRASGYDTLPDYVKEEYLTVNPSSRPGIAQNETINGIVVHYTANPGTTAEQNRDYFESLATSEETKASSHFIIGLDGEVIACVPLGELAYASNQRNMDTISIECCHEDESGQFSEATYQSLVKLTAWLCGKYGLDADDVIRHYDVTGKICPKYYVDNPDAWTDFIAEVRKTIK